MIGEVVNVDEHRLLVIERDGAEGAAAEVKRVYLVDLRDRPGGFSPSAKW